MLQADGRTSSLSRSCWTSSRGHTRRGRDLRDTRFLHVPRNLSYRHSVGLKVLGSIHDGDLLSWPNGHLRRLIVCSPHNSSFTSELPCWLHSRIHQQSGHRTRDRLIGNVIVSILPVVEHAGATEDEVDYLPAAFTLQLAGLLQSQPRGHLEARDTSGKVRSLCDLPMRASYGQPSERVHLSGWRSQSSPRSFPWNEEY